MLALQRPLPLKNMYELLLKSLVLNAKKIEVEKKPARRIHQATSSKRHCLASPA